MPEFDTDDEVDVRFSTLRPWRPGVVTGLTPNGACYEVALDPPLPTREEWTAMMSSFGDGDELVSDTLVFTQLDKLAPGQLIKARGA